MFRGLRGAFARFFEADGLFLGAGLAFFSVVGLIPLLLLAVSVVGFLLSGERAAQEVVSQITRNVPVYQREINRALLRIIETRRASGILGTVVLFVFAMPLFRALRLVMHRMLGVTVRGGFLRSLFADVFMMIVLGLLLFATTIVAWGMQWFQALVLEQAQIPRKWIAWGSLGLSLGLSGVMFFVGYRHLPRRPVRVGPAVGGAILATLLWEVAKQLFRIYIQRFALYDQIYGPLGALVAFVMFVYYSAIVFVFGAAYVASRSAGRR